MGTDNSSRTVGWTGVVVVFIVTLAVVAITSKTIDRYTEANDVAVVLAAVISPLAGLGAAVFGVKLSADSKAEKNEVKAEASSFADRLADLRGGDGGEGLTAQGGGRDDALRRLESDLRRLGR